MQVHLLEHIALQQNRVLSGAHLLQVSRLECWERSSGASLYLSALTANAPFHGAAVSLAGGGADGGGPGLSSLLTANASIS